MRCYNFFRPLSVKAWVESFDTLEEKKLGVIELHPAVFGEMPRIDVIQENVKWQQLYRFVSYAHTKVIILRTKASAFVRGTLIVQA